MEDSYRGVGGLPLFTRGKRKKTFGIHTASSLLHLSVLRFTLRVSMLVHVQQDFNNRNLVSIALEHLFSK